MGGPSLDTDRSVPTRGIIMPDRTEMSTPDCGLRVCPLAKVLGGLDERR